MIPISGFPLQVHLDNAKYFTTDKRREYSEKGGIFVTHGPVLSAWSQGFIEQMVRLMSIQLKKWASSVGFEGLDRWPMQINPAVLKMNPRVMPDYDMSPSDIIWVGQSVALQRYYIMNHRRLRSLMVVRIMG